MPALPKTNSTVIPDHTLSQFRLSDFQMAEDYFAQRYLGTVARAAAKEPPEVRERMLATANETVARGRFGYGTVNFDQEANKPTSLPYLLWLSLAIRERITPAEAEALIDFERLIDVQRAVLQMMRYPVPNAEPPAKSSTPSDPSTGNASSPPSESKDSPSATSSV